MAVPDKQVVVEVYVTDTGAVAVVPAGTVVYVKDKGAVDISDMRRSDKMDAEGNLHITYTKES
jgi:hypothetical protein